MSVSSHGGTWRWIPAEISGPSFHQETWLDGTMIDLNRWGEPIGSSTDSFDLPREEKSSASGIVEPRWRSSVQEEPCSLPLLHRLIRPPRYPGICWQIERAGSGQQEATGSLRTNGASLTPSHAFF